MEVLNDPEITLRGARSRLILGAIEILFGGLGIVAEIVFYVVCRQYVTQTYLGRYIILQIALGIVTCLLLVVAGVFGMCSQKKLWVVIVNMVFNIISAAICIIWGIFLGTVTSQSWSYSYYWYDWHPTGFYFVTLSFLDVALLLNFITAVIGASFTCTAFCPCVAVNNEGQFLAYNNAYRITPCIPSRYDDPTTPLMDPNLNPPRAGIAPFQATSYGAV
ncbi:hypothetical protein HOLleu_22335 [Holothuria leucospilota]|uniref:Uncharacterized protein n=1 Tax=Holothuria leucospilota TaxID=206669 RepID=A0A9Q1H7F7_HOLLE|nr:hypothetical protein HOLleu_22335 [Holothuria leucospilota]